MSQLQEQVLDRIKQDIEAKSLSQEENLLNVKLQQSVEELNVSTILSFRAIRLVPSPLDDHERLCQANGVDQRHTSPYRQSNQT